MIYLTLGDNYSGIYASQVIGVCKYLNTISSKPVRLISFIAIPLYRDNRKKIKAAYPEAIVLPAVPKVRNWALNYYLLRMVLWFIPEKRIMARGPFASLISQRLKKVGLVDHVIMDGRGAVHAEWNEYPVVNDKRLVAKSFELEKQAVLGLDFRLGVSHKLKDYWTREFQYSGGEHVVVPCTLNKAFIDQTYDVSTIAQRKAQRGYAPEDVIIIYSGSTAGWQSIQSVDGILTSLMEAQDNVHVLFLSRIELERLTCYQKFPDRVKKDWLKPHEVFEVLTIGDYGVLIRESSVTNEVASPTKFGEYLAAGLRVLISPGIGDYSEMVKSSNLG
ncbi:MAG: hypothetical protein AAFO91_18775, partial [Bacteroidota bacterium]